MQMVAVTLGEGQWQQDSRLPSEKDRSAIPLPARHQAPENPDPLVHHFKFIKNSTNLDPYNKADGDTAYFLNMEI